MSPYAGGPKPDVPEARIAIAVLMILAAVLFVWAMVGQAS